MNKEASPRILIAAIVVVVGVLGFWGFKIAANSGNLDQGQVKYTPGVPPWLEKDASKRGPGAAPAGATPSNSWQPVINNSGK